MYSGGLVLTNGLPASAWVDSSDVWTLKRAAHMQGAFEWRNREKIGLAQVSQSGVSVAAGAQVALALKFQSLLPEVETMLLKYKKLV
jgi:hypothetical protein